MTYNKHYKNKWSERWAFGSVENAIRELLAFKDFGVTAFTPPICGFMTRHGLLSDRSNVDKVLAALTPIEVTK
jgi:hypothetical protein